MKPREGEREAVISNNKKIIATAEDQASEAAYIYARAIDPRGDRESPPPTKT